MSQTVPGVFALGASKTGLTIGYRVLNLDRTTYSAFSTTGVGELPSGSGTYHVSGGIDAPDTGGYVVVGVSGTDYAQGAIDPAPPTVDDILDEAVEGSTTMRQMLRLLTSFVAAKTSGGGTTSIAFRDLADTKDRILMTVDVNGDRSSVTLDAS